MHTEVDQVFNIAQASACAGVTPEMVLGWMRRKQFSLEDGDITNQGDKEARWSKSGIHRLAIFCRLVREGRSYASAKVDTEIILKNQTTAKDIQRLSPFDPYDARTIISLTEKRIAKLQRRLSRSAC